MTTTNSPSPSDVKLALREYYEAKAQHDAALREFQRTEVSLRYTNAALRLEELTHAVGGYQRHLGISEESESFQVRHLVNFCGSSLFADPAAAPVHAADSSRADNSSQTLSSVKPQPKE